MTQLTLALLALAGAALLIALARGVVAVDDEVNALEATDARMTIARDADLPAFGPADRFAQALLGTDDDIAFRRALGLIEESRNPDHLPDQILELHAQAIALLQRIDIEPRGRASRASAMIGALYAEDEAIDLDAASRYRQQATEAFQAAVRLDPTNEPAKLGLELLLSGTPEAESRSGEEEDSGGITGAGRSPPGSGY